MELFAHREQSNKKRVAVMPDPYRPGSRPSFDSMIQQIQSLTSTIDRLEKRIAELDKEVREGGYVTRNELTAVKTEFNTAIDKMVPHEGRYWIVEKLVFGGVVIVLAAVIGAVLYSIGLKP